MSEPAESGRASRRASADETEQALAHLLRKRGEDDDEEADDDEGGSVWR